MCCSGGIKGELWDFLTWKKWWSTHIGFILAFFAGIVSIEYGCLEDDGDETLFELNKFISNPDGVFTDTNVFGIILLFIATFFPIFLCDIVTNFHDNKKRKSWTELLDEVKYHFIGYLIFYIIALFSFFVDSYETFHNAGIGYSIVAIVVGMMITNICLYSKIELWGKLTRVSTKNCEFYIKVGLVLLATDYQTIFAFGAPGLLVSWLIPPIVLVIMFYFGTRIMKIRNLPFVMALSAGASICGVSAIAAVAPVVQLNEEDSAISMGILTFFTIVYMIICPYVCILMNIAMDVCGAWIGGSVDETGKVVASVAILDDDDAYEVAVLVKMSQNMLIGFVCLTLAVLWDKMVDMEQRQALIKDPTMDDRKTIDSDSDTLPDSRGSMDQGEGKEQKRNAETEMDQTLGTDENQKSILGQSIYDSGYQSMGNVPSQFNNTSLYGAANETSDSNAQALHGSPNIPNDGNKHVRMSNMVKVNKKQDIDAIKKQKQDESKKMGKCEFLWKKFPKFIVGYLVLSLIITVFINPFTSENYQCNFADNIKQLSKWLFCIGFVGIGANTKFDKLWKSIKDGKYLGLYLVGQTFDTIITLGMAYIVFTYIV